MASEIEIICLDDSEDEDYSENQKDPTPETWCPKIENVYSEAKDDDLFRSITDDTQLHLCTSRRDESVLQEDNLRQTIPVSSLSTPSTSCSYQEDNRHESISDKEDDNLDQSIPDYPLVNCNVEAVSTSMSDSDNCSANQEEAPFFDESGWPFFCGPNHNPTAEIGRDLSDNNSHSAKIKRRGTNDSQSVQDVRTVFVRQKVKDGGANGSWDRIWCGDPAYISIATDDNNDYDEEEMRPLEKLPTQKRQQVLKTRKSTLGMEGPTSEEDIVNKLEKDLEKFTKEIMKKKEAEIDHDNDEEIQPLTKLPYHKYRKALVRKGSIGIEDPISEEDIGKKLERDLDKSSEGAQIGRNGDDDMEKLPSRNRLKLSKSSLGMKYHTSDFNIVNKLERDLEECSRNISNLDLDEAEINWDDDKHSTYLLSSRYKKKFMKIHKDLAQAKKISVDLGRISDKEFHVRGSSFPSVNKKLEEYINSKKIFPNFKEVYTLLKDIDVNENLFSSKSQLHEEAEKMFKLVGEQLKSRRLADEEDEMSAYLLNAGSQLDDPANEDSQLEKKLQNNRKEASRFIADACDVEEKQVDEESESEYSSEAEESNFADSTSDREDDGDMEEYDYSMDIMSDEEADEDVEYESHRKAKVTERVTPRKDNSVAEEETDTLETLADIDDLLKSSDDELESENVDDDRKITLEIPKTFLYNLKGDSPMEDEDGNKGASEVEQYECIAMMLANY